MELRIRKGLDIDLGGAVRSAAEGGCSMEQPYKCSSPTKAALQVEPPRVCAVLPDDFHGFEPKCLVKCGDAVKVGTPLLRDKRYESVVLTSPVSGIVSEVVRGDRRRILRVVVQPDNDQQYEAFDLNGDFVQLLCRSGLFAMLRRRPYDVVPDPSVRPRDIFVTALDTAPLAYPLENMLPDDASEIIGKALERLLDATDGKIYICRGANVGLHPFKSMFAAHRAAAVGDLAAAPWSSPTKGAALQGALDRIVEVAVVGPHPAGNVGVQINHLAPVNKGESVWTLDIVTLYKIGKLLADGRIDPSATVAITGPGVAAPCVVRTTQGCDIPSLLAAAAAPDAVGLHPNGQYTAARCAAAAKSHTAAPIIDNICCAERSSPTNGAAEPSLRIISGNVLTGTAVGCGEDAFLRFPWRQITIIPEGDDIVEFMGWAFGKQSCDARLKGGRRAMILSGIYDKVFPFDILPEYLLKAMISRNIDDMEALGVYEVAPEDFALCEYIDPSKLPIQQIVRDALDFLRKELE